MSRPLGTPAILAIATGISLLATFGAYLLHGLPDALRTLMASTFSAYSGALLVALKTEPPAPPAPAEEPGAPVNPTSEVPTKGTS
jgi:hypothetical protein